MDRSLKIRPGRAAMAKISHSAGHTGSITEPTVTLPGIRAQLAAAVRRVNAEFNRLPTSVQNRIEISWHGVDAEVDAAILAGDRPRAEAAIAAWKRHWLATFEEATKQ